MSTIAQALLKSQSLTHMAACAERAYRQQGITGLQVVAETYAHAGELAEHFAIGTNLHQAANEPSIPERQE